MLENLAPQVLLTPAQRTARQRRLRNKYAAPDSSVRSPDWNATVQLNQLGSSILERRPKVQLAYQLQGCVTESAAPLQPKQHVNTVLSG